MIYELTLPAGAFAAWLAAAVGLRWMAGHAWAWLSDAVRMAHPFRYAGRHVGRPALVAGRHAVGRDAVGVEHVGAEAFHPKDEFAAVGPGRLRGELDGSLDAWLADEKTEADLLAEEEEFAAEFRAETETGPMSPAAVDTLLATVDDILAQFMAKHGLTVAAVEAYPVEVAAEEIVEAVHGDIRVLAADLAFEVAASTPTGEWPIIREAVSA